VREDGDLPSLGFIARLQRPAEQGGRSNQLKEVACDPDALEALRLSRAGEIGGPVREWRESLDGRRVSFVVVQIGDRQRRTIALGPQVVHPDQAIRIGEGQVTEQHGLHEREHGRGRADAEGEHQHHEARKRRLTPHQTKRRPHVLEQRCCHDCAV
jgi:hypothetical protein